jgi:hypothetical protein
MAESYMDPWQASNKTLMPSQRYTGNGSISSVNPGDYINMNSAFELDEDYGFDLYGNPIGDLGVTPMLDKFKMGVGGVNSIMGVLGTLDAMKNNKLRRRGMEQNQKHAAMARQDRTDFLQGTKSAFA